MHVSEKLYRSKLMKHSFCLQVSMIGLCKLTKINRMLSLAKASVSSESAFAGIDIIFMGMQVYYVRQRLF